MSVFFLHLFAWANFWPEGVRADSTTSPTESKPSVQQATFESNSATVVTWEESLPSTWNDVIAVTHTDNKSTLKLRSRTSWRADVSEAKLLAGLRFFSLAEVTAQYFNSCSCDNVNKPEMVTVTSSEIFNFFFFFQLLPSGGRHSRSSASTSPYPVLLWAHVI